MDIRNPSPVELIDLVGRISSAFLYNKEEETVARDFPQLYHPNNSKNLWVGWEGETLAGHSGFFPTEMKVEGIALPVAGIGGVFTEAEFQGQGLASTLVNKCAEEAKKQGAALAFLWSDKHDLYSKLGFHLIGRQWTISFEPGQVAKLKVRGEKCGLAFGDLRFTDGEVSGEFLAQSYSMQQRYSIGIARSPEEHGLLLASGACRVIAAWAGKDLAAYFVMGKGRDLQNYVHEWAGHEGALHHLAAHCLGLFAHPFFVLSPQFMPDEVQWIYSLDEMGISLRAEKMGLVKLLDFAKVKRLVADYMERMGLKSAELVLAQNGDRFSVTWREKTSLDFSESEFLRFLFGPDMPAHQELKAFLPLRLWYWGMDSV
jgi:GNAT superfamily N-acetyltransferase